MVTPVGSNILAAQSEEKIVDTRENLALREEPISLVSLILFLQVAATISESSSGEARSSNSARKVKRYSPAATTSYPKVSKAAKPCFHRQNGKKR